MASYIIVLKSGIMFVVTCCLFAGASSAVEFAGGAGEPNDPYRIATAEQLISIGSDPNLLDKHFVLVDDIDLDPNLPGRRVFTEAVIAPGLTNREHDFQGVVFTGSFDGDGHTIRNLKIDTGSGHDDGDYVGLFGKVGRQAVVKNLGIETESDGINGVYRGALAGWNDGCVVDCHVRGFMIGGFERVGGLVGYNSGDIIRCRADFERIAGLQEMGGLVSHNNSGGRIIGCSAATSDIPLSDGYAGGLAGINEGDITGSCATGNISIQSRTGFAGGLVGRTDPSSRISNCYATVNISARGKTSCLGGLIGLMSGGNVSNCFATGSISGGAMNDSLGGLVGSVGDGSIRNCYAAGQIRAGKDSTRIGGLIGAGGENNVKASFWDAETSGLSESAGGTGLTTAQMWDVQSFLPSGWDFVGERANGTTGVWRMPQGGGYPALTLSSSYDPPKLIGSGTPGDPYRIGTPEDLGAVWHDPFACYELTADIDLSDVTWGTAPVEYFNGAFHGAGFIISHLSIRGRGCLGLFASLGPQAVVTDLGIEDANITSEDEAEHLGILAGYNKGSISRCYVTGRISAGNRNWSAGGLVGVNGTYPLWWMDGAYPLSPGTIANCYAIATVSIGEDSGPVGGLVGESQRGTLTNCYVASQVSAKDKNWSVGGLVGEQTENSTIIDCHFLDSPEVSGPPYNGIGVPLTDEQMKQQASFTGWDFESTWTICEGRDYPRLRWEQVQCEP